MLEEHEKSMNEIFDQTKNLLGVIRQWKQEEVDAAAIKAKEIKEEASIKQDAIRSNATESNLEIFYLIDEYIAAISEKEKSIKNNFGALLLLEHQV